MSQHHFNHLPRHRQLSYTLKYGTMIAECKGDNLQMLLFQVGGMYVEIQKKVSEEKVLQVMAFDDVHLLSPYLAGIDISGLTA